MEDLGGAGEDLGGRRTPFRRVSFSLQTSLISPNFPARQPPDWFVKISRVLWAAVAVQGSFGLVGRCEDFAECGFALDWWAGRVGNVCLARVEIDPPSSVAVATASPRGEAIYTLCEHGKQLCEHSKQKMRTEQTKF